MPSPKINRLLIKYVSHSATSEDIDVLESWIKNLDNIPIFKEYVKTHFVTQLSMNDPDTNDIKKRLLSEIRKDKRILQRRKIRSTLKYAAVVIIFIGVGYFIKKHDFNENKEYPIVPKEDVVTLQLENGDIKILSEDGTSEVRNANGEVIGAQSGNRLQYNGKSDPKELRYNTLSVPYGKRFDIVLSDSTKVFMNSGSKIRYPVQFLKGHQREVYLEGEAFFEVAHDEERPFIVNAEEVGIEVLGTRFNVSNYGEDAQTEAVLVSGSVQLAMLDDLKNDAKLLLRPGYKGSFNKAQQDLTTQKVNTAIYTSWINGQVVFRNASFDNIIQKLQRHYNIIIINNNSQIANETFNATIDVDEESIEKVLEYFNKIYGIEYKIFQNKVIIN